MHRLWIYISLRKSAWAIHTQGQEPIAYFRSLDDASLYAREMASLQTQTYHRPTGVRREEGNGWLELACFD